MNKRMSILIVLVLGIVISSHSALALVSCSTTSVYLTYNSTQIPSDDVSIASCSNDGNVTTISLGGAGVPTLITKGDDLNTISGTKTLRIRISDSIPNGQYPLLFSFGDGSPSVSVNLNIESQQMQTPPGSVIVFPTSKVVTVKLGQTKTYNVQVIVPSSYDESITIQSISFNPDIDLVSFGDLDLGVLSPGQTLNIPVVVNSQDVQTGTYNTKVNVLATNSLGQLNLQDSSLQITVQATTNPSTSNTLNSPPICSLSGGVMNINQTYSLICTNVQSNIDVHPILNEYFEGVSAETSNSVYSYIFKPKKNGVTKFEAYFTYLNAPFFSKFSQEVRIQGSGTSIGSSDLNIIFTPSLQTAKDKEEIIIQLVDNQTNSLVERPEMFIDAVSIPLNNSVFRFTFRAEKNYSVRGRAPGYNDLVRDVSLSSKSINITITPSSGNPSTIFNITTDANATIYLNGNNVGNSYYGNFIAGTNRIEAIREGYLESSRNFTVEESVLISTFGEFKKNNIQMFTLSKNATWEVYFQENGEAPQELLSQGMGNKIEFTPTNKGIYTVKAEGSQQIYEIKGIDWNAKWWFMAWYLWIALIGMASLIVIKMKNSGGNSNIVPFGGNVNTG